MHANLIETNGNCVEGENEAIEAVEAMEAKIALSKFNASDNAIKIQLHESLHLNYSDFQTIAVLYFTVREMKWIPIFIRTRFGKHCDFCRNGGNIDSKQMIKYKRIEKQNCHKIDEYFDGINKIIQVHHQRILQKYKQKSQETFLNDNNSNNPEIQFIPSINHKLDELFTNSYHITNCDIPSIPKIKVTENEMGNLRVSILDNNNNNKSNDKYIVSINDTTQEFKSDDIIITDIKPLKEYSISVKRQNNNNKWSTYCSPQIIKTGFKCIWSQTYHGTNVSFEDNGYIRCKSTGRHCTILSDIKYVFRSIMFKKVKFILTMKEFGPCSYFGFIEYNNNAMNDINFNSTIIKNPYSYCLGFRNGSDEIKKFIKGNESKDTDKVKLHNPSNGWFKSKARKINNGDKFIFVIDFERRKCNVFVNEEIISNKIAVNLNANTFDNIPANILPVYSHSYHRYIASDSYLSIDTQSEYLTLV